MTTLISRVTGMQYGYDSPEIKSLSLNSRLFPRTSRLNIDDIQKPYNYLPKANRPYKEAKQTTEIADRIQKLYDSYDAQIYNRTNAIVLEEINQQIFDNSRKRVKWSKTLGFLESQTKKYADSLDSVSLNYLINLHNMLSPHVNKCIEKYKKAEDAEYARDYLIKSACDLEKRHKVVSYDEASGYLDDKVTDITRGTSLLNKTGGSPKSVYFKVLGTIVLAAWVATSSIGWWNSAKDAKIYKNKAEGLETTLASVLKEYDGLKNKVSAVEAKINEVESKNSLLQSAFDGINKKYDEEKSVQEQGDKLPEIPIQGGKAQNTNFSFGHKTPDHKITGNGGNFKGGWYKNPADPSIPAEFDSDELALRRRKQQLYDEIIGKYARGIVQHPIGSGFYVGGVANTILRNAAVIPTDLLTGGNEKAMRNANMMFGETAPFGDASNKFHSYMLNPKNWDELADFVKKHKLETAFIISWDAATGRIVYKNVHGNAGSEAAEFGDGEIIGPGLN
ncbi:hypothetical protein HYU07_04260 [Candidatus Woesearchaeota archaeon]|nr:hypothetical protein [Candidatus Woesearchaeota archaeon]